MIVELREQARALGVEAAPGLEGLEEEAAARAALKALAGAELIGWTVRQIRPHTAMSDAAISFRELHLTSGAHLHW